MVACGAWEFSDEECHALRNGEPMLIDMEALCMGQPIFDLEGIYVAYQAFPRG